jgi:hypothetical protein
MSNVGFMWMWCPMEKSEINFDNGPVKIIKYNTNIYLIYINLLDGMYRKGLKIQFAE